MSAPADERRQLIDQLAALVVEDRREAAAKERDPRKTPYYLLNISHPVLRQFYLDLTLTCGRTAGNDIRDQKSSIHNLAVQFSLQIIHLCR